MPRIVGIDYGKIRSGVSATDILQIAVHPLKAIETKELFDFLVEYFNEEEVEKLVFGLPTHQDGNPTYLVPEIYKFAEKISEQFPDIVIDYQEEAYSSKEASEIILISGVKKKARRDKSKIDLVSAVIILQRYLNHIP